MNLAKSMNYCVRTLRTWRTIPKVSCKFDQRRCYKSDDPDNWSARRAQDIRDQVSEGPSGAKDPDSRRRITQDTIDHQRRQERIIADNKRRWQKRTEPKAPSVQLSQDFTVYDAKNPRKSRQDKEEDQSAEDYSRRRRQKRLKEVKRQERELRESRRGYKLPSAEYKQSAPETGETTQTPEPSGERKSWFDRQARENEERYWHTWSTCPDERRVTDSAEDVGTDGAPGDKPSKNRGLVKPTLPYDSSVRRYQTHSSQAVVERTASVEPPRYGESEEHAANPRRRPSGMEKQYLLARDSARHNKDSLKHPSSLLQSHVFKLPATSYAERKDALELEDIGLPKQPLRSKLPWQGLPRPVYRRFNGIKRAVAKSQLERNNGRKCEPPRYTNPISMTRRRPPIDSFSNMLAVNTQYTPFSEYTGYGRQTVCDAWQNFTNKSKCTE